MISLLLTLFICLFSFSPTFHQVDLSENNNVKLRVQEPREAIYEPGDTLYTNLMSYYCTDWFYQNLYAWLINTGGVARWGYDNTLPQDYTYTVYDGYNGDFEISNTISHLIFTNVYSFPVDSVRILREAHSWTNPVYSSLEGTEFWYTVRFNFRPNTYLDNDHLDYLSIRFDILTNLDWSPIQEGSYLFEPVSVLVYKYDGSPFTTYAWEKLELTFNYQNIVAPYGFRDVLICNYIESQSYNRGYNVGYNEGVDEGYNEGYDDGLAYGYQDGYTAGYNDGTEVDNVASTIFTGIFDVGLLPINVFLTIFNFEVFGVNISGILSGLLTLSIVVIVLRFLLGGKKDD